MVGLLVGENMKGYLEFLGQFDTYFTFIAPNQFAEQIDMLIIPSLNAFSGYESNIRRTGFGSPQIDTFGRDFYEGALEKYILHGTKIVAFGHSADMLWHILGGSLVQVTKEPGLNSYLGSCPNNPIMHVEPKLGTVDRFHHTAYFNQYYDLEKGSDKLSAFAWEAPISRADYLKDIKHYSDVDNYVLDNQCPIAAFQANFGPFFGLKEDPTAIKHKKWGAVNRKFGIHMGSALAFTVINYLINGGPEPTAVEVPVPNRYA